MPVCTKITCNIKELPENRMFHVRDCKTRLLQPLLQHADMESQFRTHFRRVTTNGFLIRRIGDYAGAASWVSGGASTSVTRRGEGIPRKRKTAGATLSGSGTTRYR